MLRLFLILFISVNTWTQSFDEDVSKHLSICSQGDTSCKCEAPYITNKDFFSIAPELKKQEVLNCDVSITNLDEILSCILAPRIYGRKYCMREDSNKCNLNSTPPLRPSTYISKDILKQNCGYNWVNFSVKKYKKILDKWIHDEQVSCHESMCTSAVFLAFISQAKKKLKEGLLSQEKFDEISQLNGPAYEILNNNAEPNKLVELYGLGTGHTVNLKKKDLDKLTIPKKGDLVQIWRKSNSGHSVVFKGLIDSDNDGKTDLFCYWSSQKSTNGYGNVCEEIAKLDRLLIGHLK